MRNYTEKQPLNIIEIGGGSGRLAKDILVCSLDKHRHNAVMQVPDHTIWKLL